MGFFSESTDIEQVSTQTKQQRQITRELLSQLMQLVQGAGREAQPTVAPMREGHKQLFSRVDEASGRPPVIGGPQNRDQRQRSAAQARHLERGPAKRTLDPKSEIAQGMHATLGKVLKNLQ